MFSPFQVLPVCLHLKVCCWLQTNSFDKTLFLFMARISFRIMSLTFPCLRVRNGRGGWWEYREQTAEFPSSHSLPNHAPPQWHFSDASPLLPSRQWCWIIRSRVHIGKESKVSTFVSVTWTHKHSCFTYLCVVKALPPKAGPAILATTAY